jgi:ketosteroid isomerase-like protein
MTPSETSIGTALRRFYEAEERYIASGGDNFDEVAQWVHPDYVLRQAPSLPFGGEWHGHEGLERFLDVFVTLWDSLDVVDPQVHEVGGGTVITLVTMHARSRATGRTLRMPICQVLRFDDGLLREVTPYYWDAATTNEVLGARP